MNKLDAIERAEAFARRALVNDLHQNASDDTIRAVALKMVKAVSGVRMDKPSRQSERVNCERAEVS